jgi:uncharacterized protein (AIM24 family)
LGLTRQFAAQGRMVLYAGCADIETEPWGPNVVVAAKEGVRYSARRTRRFLSMISGFMELRTWDFGGMGEIALALEKRNRRGEEEAKKGK